MNRYCSGFRVCDVDEIVENGMRLENRSNRGEEHDFDMRSSDFDTDSRVGVDNDLLLRFTFHCCK